MPFFVVVDQECSPDVLDRTLATIHADFATSRACHPGRRHTRVFQRLNQPSHLLTIGEWEHQADYERLRQSARYRELVVCADLPARIEPLRRLRYFARMSTRPSIVACVTMTAPGHVAEALHSNVLHATYQHVVHLPGLLTHEVYQVGASPSSLLVVHGWRTLGDLERFWASEGPDLGLALAALGVTVTRFTGAVAAQFSRLEEQTDAATGQIGSADSSFQDVRLASPR